MSRLSSHPVRAQAALGALLLGLVVSASGCEEDGKTAPDRCLEPALLIFDIQTAGAPADDNARFNDDLDANGNLLSPCVTKVGHSVSNIGSPTTPTTAGTGGSATAGNGGKGGKGGKGGSGGTATANAGAGGAP